MAGPVLDSQVFAALLAAHDRLTSIEFPVSIDTGDPPIVVFMSGADEVDREFVELVGKVDDVEAEAATIGPAMNAETFQLLIRVATVIEGSEGPEAIARLGVLAGAVQAAWRDPVSGLPLPLPIGGVVVSGGLERVEVTPYPNTDLGWGATADLYYRIYARI